MSIDHLRKEYSRAQLSKSDVASDPVEQFSKWFEEARLAQVPERNAMSLATINAQGRPSSRIVLIKEFDQRGFTWFTNYSSRKGQDLESNPHAALLFHWVELERQVRIEGRVEKISATENDIYFESRPLNSRLGAIASAQSQIVENRAILEDKFIQAQAEYGDNPPRPAHWGGYRLIPDYLEFWQGRNSRLHDRIVYIKQSDGEWSTQRLQP